MRLADIAAAKPDTLQLISGSGTLDVSDRIVAFAIAQRLPSFSPLLNFVELGGLLTYGPPRRKIIITSGYYVKRILEGANPGQLRATIGSARVCPPPLNRRHSTISGFKTATPGKSAWPRCQMLK
jgi:hypothetical protein